MDLHFFLFVVFITIVDFGCVTADETRVTVKEGENAVLECSFETDFNLVIWKRDDSVTPLTVGESVFSGDYRLSIERKEKSWLLKIENVVMSDSAEYQCRASKDGHTVVKSFVLDVQSVPGTKQPEYMYTEANVTVTAGQSALLTCSAEDHNLYHVIWKKEGTGTAISVNRLVFIRDNRISLNINKLNWDLIIKDVNPSDSGKYICLAMDGSRSVKTIYNLEVLPVSDNAKTTAPTSTTQKLDDSNTETTNEQTSSSEINEELLKQTQLQFYQEEILTDQKKRQLMDIEKDFFEVARRYFKSRTEKDNVH